MSLGKPQRLEQVFRKYEPPLYFVTLCTARREPLLATGAANSAVVAYGVAGMDPGHSLGRYVIMPDHLHLFVRVVDGFSLGSWVAGLKRVVAAAVSGGRNRTIWQRGFFDHLIRSGESYSQKWDYARENPVRAGLVTVADEWAFQGEIVTIEQ